MAGSNSVVRLGVVQMAMRQGRDANLAKAVRLVDEAATKGADIVCLPELFSTPYFPQREHEKVSPEPIPGPTSKALASAARHSHVFLVGGSIHERAGSRTYNTSVVFDNQGRTLGKYRKVHVPYDPYFYEQSYFSPGAGYRVFNTPFGKIAPLICFDQWYPEPARICRLRGASILFYPTAIGWVKGVEATEGDWQEAWETVQRGHSIANGVIVCAVNRVGVEGDMTFWGGSFVCDQFGKVLFRAGDNESVSVVEVGLALGEEVENGWGFLRNRKPSTYKTLAE